jgi:hypothetical protein
MELEAREQEKERERKLEKERRRQEEWDREIDRRKFSERELYRRERGESKYGGEGKDGESKSESKYDDFDVRGKKVFRSCRSSATTSMTYSSCLF